MESKIIVAPASGNTNHDALASRRSAPPYPAGSYSSAIVRGAHQMVAASRARVQGQLLAAGFVPRSLRSSSLPAPALAARSASLVEWARQVVFLADAAEQSRYIDALIGSPSETWEVQI